MEPSSRRWRVADLIASGKLVIGDGYRAKNSELSAEGLPFARAGNVNDGFRFDGADRFPEEHLDRVGQKVSRPGDVVFTSKGTVGRFAYVQWSTPPFVYSPQLCFWRSLDDSVINPRFLYYWMYSREFSTQVRGVAGQTDMAEYVSLRDQRKMHVTLPGIRHQERVSEVLGALDDKIELNRRMNETLEATAQAVFKSWFVDFAGVDELEVGSIGPTPAGWDVLEVGSVVEVVGGSTPSTKEPAYWEGGTHAWATPKDLSGLSVPVLLATSRQITDDGLRTISSGLLPPGTLLLSSRAPIGYTAIAQIPVAVNQGFIAIPPGGMLSPTYMLFWIRLNMDAIKGRAGGTTFPEISKKAFRPIPIAVPPQDRLDAFARIVDPILERIARAGMESATLARIRDALLPKLISGELRIPDAERLVSEVT